MYVYMICIVQRIMCFMPYVIYNIYIYIYIFRFFKASPCAAVGTADGARLTPSPCVARAGSLRCYPPKRAREAVAEATVTLLPVPPERGTPWKYRGVGAWPP